MEHIAKSINKMNRLQRFKFLSIFGSGETINWFQVINLGVRHLEIHQHKLEHIFKQALDYHLIMQVPSSDVTKIKKQSTYVTDWTMYDYKIAPRGDTCLREEQIARDGDVSYYKYYDRSLDGAHGLNKYAPIPKHLERYTAKSK